MGTISSARFATWIALAFVTLCLPSCVNGVRSGLQCDSNDDCFAPAVCSQAGLCLVVAQDALCDHSPCTAPVVVTLGAESAVPGTIELRGRLEAHGGSAVTEHGFCWTVEGTPMPGALGTTCSDLGSLAEPDEFVAQIDAPTSAAAVRYRAFATNAVSTGLGAVLAADFASVGPLRVAASDGDYHGAVEVDWDVSPGITLYRLYRDGDLVATVGAPPWTDEHASPGGFPDAPQPTATGNQVFIQVSWPVTGAAPGDSHLYEVVAIGADGAAEGSGSDAGFAAGEPSNRYQVSVDGGPFTGVTRPEFIDTDAPPPWVDVAIGASVEMEFGQVRIACDAPVIHEAPVRTYVVRASNTHGTSEDSAPVAARRSWSGPFYRFYRQDFDRGDGTGVREIGLTETGSFIDADALPDGLLAAYSCQSWLRGGDVASGPVRTGWAAMCDDTHPCGEGLQCTAGRCAPPGFTAIPPAWFALSLTASDSLADDDEDFVHNQLTGGFVIATTEVTQREWAETMGENPSFFAACGDSCPVENISWWSALAFLNALSARDGFPACYELSDSCTGRAANGTLDCPSPAVVLSATGSVYDCEGYRLPTEAEWVLAARGVAGNHDADGVFGPNGELNCTGPTAPSLDAFAWLCGNSTVAYPGCAASREGLIPCAGTHAVGELNPNLFGIYDVIGNVDELTWDGFALFADGEPYTDYAGPADQGESRVAHGGSWYDAPADARVADRHRRLAGERSNEAGLRVARTWR